MRGRRVLRIRVETPLKPTEVAERVHAAVRSLFPDVDLREEDGRVVAEPADLDRLRDLVRNQRIPDSARGAMLAGLSADGSEAHFLLGKQAAAAGRAHFGPARGPLGEVEVILRSDEAGEVERAIYRAAPDTTCPREWAEVPPSERPPEATPQENGDAP